MADTAVAITAGTGTSIDTRTESTNGHHRQVIVIGDPAENASVLGVNASQGIKVYSETAQAVTNAGLTNLDVLLSTRLASGSTLPITNKFLDTPLSNLLASGSTLPITNSYLENMDVLLSTRLASGSTLPITNTYLDIPLSTRLASGSTLPITNSYLSNIDTLLSTRLASGTTVPITGTVSVTGNVAVTNAGLTELAAAINASSQMDVNIAASAISFGGTSAADDADFTATTTAGTPAMGVYESTPTTVTDGDLGTVGITSGRRLKTSATIDAALPAGTNAIGKLAANSGVDIGDVTIDNASIAVTQSGTWDEVGINDSGNSITVDYATTGSGTATGALRVELPTNGTGVIATVGAVTAITNALPAGTNAIGKLAANSGVDIGDVDITSIAAGNNNIGDVDIASIAAGNNNIGDVDIASIAAGTNTIGKVAGVPSDIDINGSNANHADKYYTNAGAVTDGIVWSPAAGKRWHVLTLYINVSAAATVTLEDDLAGGDVARWKGELAANSGVVLTYDKEHPFSSGEDAADLLITTSAGNVYCQAVGYEV